MAKKPKQDHATPISGTTPSEQGKPDAHETAAKLAALLGQGQKKEAEQGEVETPAKKTASRSNFKGELIIPNPSGGILSRIPVKTFKAVDEDKIERHMYHGVQVPNTDGTEGTRLCMGSLKQQASKCSDCGVIVENALKNAAYGVEVGNKVVLLSDEEMKAQQPMRDGAMKILEYIDESEINPIYYEDTEFVAPDGTAPVLTAFAMLVEGLKRTGSVAKGVRIKGGREQYFTLRPYGQHGMTLHYLYADYEVRNCDKWTPIAVPEELTQVMAQLIEVTRVKFTPAAQDTYSANVRRLIKQKSLGVEPTVPKQEAEQAPATDLEAALKAALNQAQTAKAATVGGKN